MQKEKIETVAYWYLQGALARLQGQPDGSGWSDAAAILREAQRQLVEANPRGPWWDTDGPAARLEFWGAQAQRPDQPLTELEEAQLGGLSRSGARAKRLQGLGTVADARLKARLLQLGMPKGWHQAEAGLGWDEKWRCFWSQADLGAGPMGCDAPWFDRAAIATIGVEQFDRHEAKCPPDRRNRWRWEGDALYWWEPDADGWYLVPRIQLQPVGQPASESCFLYRLGGGTWNWEVLDANVQH